MPVDAVAKQCELLQVIAITWCDERNVAYHRLTFELRRFALGPLGTPKRYIAYGAATLER